MKFGKVCGEWPEVRRERREEERGRENRTIEVVANCAALKGRWGNFGAKFLYDFSYLIFIALFFSLNSHEIHLPEFRSTTPTQPRSPPLHQSWSHPPLSGATLPIPATFPVLPHPLDLWESPFTPCSQSKCFLLLCRPDREAPHLRLQEDYRGLFKFQRPIKFHNL